MSCVNYWVTCKDCKHEDYLNKPATGCTKCGSINLSVRKEWDEQEDHHPDRELYEETSELEEDDIGEEE